MIYAIVANLIWAAAAGLLHAPTWIVILGALAAAALWFWLDRAKLTAAAPKQTWKRYAMLAAAYCFVAMVAAALDGVIYAGVALLRHKYG